MGQLFKKVFVYSFFGLLTTLVACQAVNTTSGGAVGVQREQYMFVSAEQVENQSAKAYRKILQEESKKGHLNENFDQVQRVRKIAKHLISQVGVFRKDAQSWAWEVNVITSKEVNAWCMAGGKMAVFTGLIEQLKLDDDELAAVIGHEIAHALREHSRERASGQMFTNLGVAVSSALLGLGQAGNEVLGQAVNLTLSLPHSRAHEVEADRIGVELAARGGYDPMAAVRLWKKMARLSGAKIPQLLSTHPAPESRMAAITQDAELVRPLYLVAKKVN